MKPNIIVAIFAVFALMLCTPCKVFSQQSKGKELEISSLPLNALVEVKPRVQAYLKARTQQIAELALNYERVIESRLNKAADAGDLKTAKPFQEEKERVEALMKILAVEDKDPFVAAQRSDTLSDFSSGTPEALVTLRKIWTKEWKKIRLKLDRGLQLSLKKLETDLTKARDFKSAKGIFAFRESLLSGSPVVAAATANSKGTPASTSPMNKGSSLTATATIEKPFENSLGMRFVPVPITGGPTDGKAVLFSIWETRVKDYEAFIRKDRARYWEKPGFKQKSDHPAVNLSWEDAVAFCSWLTVEERKKGLIENTQVFRLPTDHEWSCAVGIGADEDAEAPPISKIDGHPGVYPWGNVFPPIKGAGNYYGEEMSNNPLGSSKPIAGYDDGFEITSPVGSFNANAFGLYDMGGNVKEWCGDFVSPTEKDRRIARDAAWSLFLKKEHLGSAQRNPNPPAFTHFSYGFRIVLTTP